MGRALSYEACEDEKCCQRVKYRVYYLKQLHGLDSFESRGDILVLSARHYYFEPRLMMLRVKLYEVCRKGPTCVSKVYQKLSIYPSLLLFCIFSKRSQIRQTILFYPILRMTREKIISHKMFE